MEQLGESHRHRSVCEDTKTEGEVKYRTQMKDAQATWF